MWLSVNDKKELQGAGLGQDGKGLKSAQRGVTEGKGGFRIETVNFETFYHCHFFPKDWVFIKQIQRAGYDKIQEQLCSSS